MGTRKAIINGQIKNLTQDPSTGEVEMVEPQRAVTAGSGTVPIWRKTRA